MNIKQLDLKREFDVIAILILAFALRIYGYWDWSLTSDELSAMLRTNYNSISDLFQKGIWVDGHPALTQVFHYYWKKLSGDSVFTWRLPFVLFSCLGTLYFYRFAKSVLNKNAALIALAVLSTSQLFILYSQIARPYSIGFFFTMAFTYHWYNFIRNPRIDRHFYLLIVFGVLGAYTHYFSSLCILLILLAGFFFIKRKLILLYLYSALIMLILYLPHLPITLNHLSIGGVNWLPEPELDYILFFLTLAFNESGLFKLLVFVGVPLALLLKPDIKFKKSLALLAIFLLNYGIAYFYSVYRSPVIQHSIFIFSFPFFLLFLASFFGKSTSRKVIYSYCALLLVTGIYSLIYVTNFYNEKKFGSFLDVANDAIQVKKEYDEASFIAFSNSSNHEYFSYYFRQYGDSINYDINHFSDQAAVIKARDIIEASSKEYVLTGFANSPIPYEVHEFIKLSYPEIVFANRYFNSESILYKRGEQERAKIFSTHFSDFNREKKWEVNANYFSDSSSIHKPVYEVTSDQEYLLTYKDTVKNLFKENNSFLTIKAKIKGNIKDNLLLVVSIERNGESIQWKGSEVKEFIKQGEWAQFLTVFHKKHPIEENDLISIYFWNRDRETALISDFEIVNFEDSDYNYYQLIAKLIEEEE